MASATTVATSLAHINHLSTSNPLPSGDSAQVQIVRAVKWEEKIARQGAWNEQNDPLSLAGAPSLPMPVEVSSKEALAPFFAHLSSQGTHEPADGGITGVEPFYNTELIEFEKGVLYADGRVDLCKMVTGPRNIGDLMRSLKPNTFAKHFLLGNNIIGPTGATAIADFIKEYPERFETWYLAGNCIDSASLTTLVDAMTTSPVTTNVWLKRNPLMPEAAKDVFRLVARCPSLRTLDLDQTEIGDAGVSELFKLLAASDEPCALRHIYLNACGIGKKGCEAINSWLSSPNCRLESLYISDNPIGDAISYLAPGIKSSTTIQRLSIQSCGLKDKETITLLDALNARSSLEVLDLGQAYATNDLGMRYNWLTDSSSHALIQLISTTSLKYLNLSYLPTSQSSLNRIYEAVLASPSLVWFAANPLVKGGKTYHAVKAGQESARLLKLVKEHLAANVQKQYVKKYSTFENEDKRFLVSPHDVRYIDSVYRNRDAGLARRGLKRLEKWWQEGDETLQRVADGVLD